VALHVADEQHQFILWDKVSRDEHSDLAFQYSSQSSLSSHLARILQENNAFLIPEGCSHGFSC
jgi:dTDP-4-dehydrorhamnose 3,5-epimerase-like enzyme